MLVDASPCLLKMLKLVGWPSMVKRVEGFDVVDNDLVCRIKVLVAVEVKGGI